MSEKKRLDLLLVQRGLFASREQAGSAIMAGLVFVNQMREEKSGTKVPMDAQIEVKGAPHPYVGRGGLKLQRAIQAFDLKLKHKVILDIGASTGGFTDCALQHGAIQVYAVDVGYGQLAWKLRQDPRVTVMERTNFRYLQASDLPQPSPDVATIDVSFISLMKIFPVLSTVLRPSGEVVALIKPQFEAGKGQVGKKGVVRDPAVHQAVISDLLQFAQEGGFYLQGLTYSPIKGGEGNIEYLAYFLFKGKEIEPPSPLFSTLQEVVSQAHEALARGGV